MATPIAQLRPHATSDDGSTLLRSLLSASPSFDPDAWHVMQERDNALIRDELMHGAASKAFVYDFNIKGTRVTGVSVVGARELAAQYKGIKSRIVATVEKRGSLFIFRTFTPLSIETRLLPELADETDFYECVVEVTDIKSGNSIEVRKKESKTESKRDGGSFDRPHYDVIAESKAFRNGVLSVLPQSVINDFKNRCLTAGNASQEVTIGQLRQQAAGHAAKHGLPFDRGVLSGLTYDELRGLGAAAGQGLEQFKRAATALGLFTASSSVDPETGEVQPPAAAPRQSAASKAPVSDAEAFAIRLAASNDIEALDLLADEIRGVADADTAQTLSDVYQRRRAELVDHAGQQPAATGQASGTTTAPASRRRTAPPAGTQSIIE